MWNTPLAGVCFVLLSTATLSLRIVSAPGRAKFAPAGLKVVGSQVDEEEETG